MSKTLVIVESPAKAKTIAKYLGSEYIVKSSVGHIRDLPTGKSKSPIKRNTIPKDLPEDEKKRLTNAINILNESWNKFSNLHGKVSDLKIITLISLELQDSIKDYEDKLKLQRKNIDLLKQETEEKSNDLQNTIKKVDQLNLEIEIKDKEILKTESVLDEINHELSQIKIKILANNDE